MPMSNVSAEHKNIPTDSAITAKVLARAAQMQRQRTQRRHALCTMAAVACSLALVCGLSLQMPAWMAQVGTYSFANDTAAATLLSSSPFLGYMVVGCIAFVLGAFVTAIAYRWRDDDDKEE